MSPARPAFILVTMHNRLAKYGYLFMLLTTVAIIAASGYGFVQQQIHLAVAETRLDIATIADLKVTQIVEWRKERLLEANAIHSNTMVSNRIKGYLNGRDAGAALNEIQSWMANLKDANNYTNLILFRPNGEVLISASPITKPLAGDRDIIKAAVQNKEVSLSDLHIHKDAGEFDINLIIPILDPDAEEPVCIAVMAIDINPMIHLYPLLRKWPTPSRTGENLLVRHDGDEVLYLNELRFSGDSAITLRQPLTEKNMPAVRAALGQEGVFEGHDYRGEDVIAAVRIVTGSPWAMVCKIDRQEVLEPVSNRIRYVVGTCVLVSLAAGMAFYLWWRRKRESYLLLQYDSELKFNRELRLAEQSLQEANNLLENRVALRTAELSSSNTQLRQEIAERKQVEELLRKHFEAIQQSPVAIVITDLEGTIEFVNPKFTEYSGYHYDEAIGQNPRILKSEQTPTGVYRQLWETLTAGQIWEGDFCNRKKSGEIFWEHAKILPIKNQKGTVTNFMAFKEDITKHLQLEEKLSQARKLETIGQIAGGVAHEVRNPLNAILSITEALFREEEFDNNPEFTPYIQHIRTQVSRLANLMNDLLDLGKTISTNNLHAVALLDLCRQTVELWKVSGMAENRNVAISAAAGAEAVRVMADAGRLQQVIFNLLENAGNHSPAGSTITLQLKEPLTVSAEAIVHIIDSGRGIPEEKLSRVFDPFYSERRGGTGLGLSLVKHFIENMAGSVRIWNNDPPPGCTAEIRIPLAVEEQT
ncbi:MAG: PAS domain S-box protein [Geobacteraceae bacterium]|nr:PAS domain S-box protein [Geobacteraceae bacterium]